MLRYLLLILMLLWMTPTVYASYAVVNSENGGLLIGQQPHEPLPVASLTKIWTAYIVLQNSNLQDLVEISHIAAHMEGSSIYLQEGQRKSVEYLLYGLLLRSGNDAAAALAEHVGGSEQGFVKLMNDAAISHVLQHTHFENPSGLHHDRHAISAYDMAQMLNIATQHPKFREIASSTYYTDGSNHFMNKHRLIGNGKALAGKTGYTKVAGRTLATYYELPDRQFTVVTLNEANDWLMHEQLAELVQKRFTKRLAVEKGQYAIAGKTIIVERPIEILSQNGKDMQHFIRFSRLQKKEALWHVMQDGHMLAIKRVKVK